MEKVLKRFNVNNYLNYRAFSRYILNFNNDDIIKTRIIISKL